MTFSIVTPSFNSGRWLPSCVASVGDQGVNFQHLVQDGGSTDGALEWLRGRDDVCLESAPDQGMYDAVNRGLKRGQGEICAYLNCDEQYLPGALIAVRETFRRNPETDVLFANTVCVKPDGAFVCHRKVVVPTLDHTLLCHLATLSAAMFFRRRLLDAGFWFDPTFRAAGDADWVARLIASGVRMDVLPGYTSVFTFTGTNLSESGQAVLEQARLAGRLPAWRRSLRLLVKIRHRLRKWRCGAYRQEPFDYSIHVAGAAERRSFHSGPNPGWRWPASR